MLIKTILNRIEKHTSFVYKKFELIEPNPLAMEMLVHIVARNNSRPVCSKCGKQASTYQTSRKPRRFEFVPLWGISVFFLYHMRRVNCPRCGVIVEKVPWANGKQPITTTYSWFLARWAKRLPWNDVAEVFKTSWATVWRAVQMAVQWGLEHRDLVGITAIGVDEVQFHRGHKYLTVVYQINEGCKRLIWVGLERRPV